MAPSLPEKNSGIKPHNEIESSEYLIIKTIRTNEKVTYHILYLYNK